MKFRLPLSLQLLILALLVINLQPLKVLAQSANSGLSAAVGGLVLRIPNLTAGESSSFYFLAGTRPISDVGYIVGQIKTKILKTDPLDSVVEIRSKRNNQLNPGIKLLPDGGVVIGGVSNNNLNPGSPTNTTPLDLPPGFENLPQNHRNNGIYDFYLTMPMPDDPRDKGGGLFIRQLVAHDNSNPTNLVIRRSGGSSDTRYGEIGQLQKGESIGTIKWESFINGVGFRSAAALGVTLEDLKANPKNPEGFTTGTLYLDTTGDEGELIHRLGIRPDGRVVIGRDVRDQIPQAQLHVLGDIKAEGTITGASKNFEINHPTKPGERLVHSSLEGPENAVYYRGEGQLLSGEAVIELPDYFEALTRIQGRTVLLTNIDGFDQISVKTTDGQQIQGGRLTVYSNNQRSSQKFNWEVKAVRSDLPILEVEK